MIVKLSKENVLKVARSFAGLESVSKGELSPVLDPDREGLMEILAVQAVNDCAARWCEYVQEADDFEIKVEPARPLDAGDGLRLAWLMEQAVAMALLRNVAYMRLELDTARANGAACDVMMERVARMLHGKVPLTRENGCPDI